MEFKVLPVSNETLSYFVMGHKESMTARVDEREQCTFKLYFRMNVFNVVHLRGLECCGLMCCKGPETR